MVRQTGRWNKKPHADQADRSNWVNRKERDMGTDREGTEMGTMDGCGVHTHKAIGTSTQNEDAGDLLTP